MNHDVEILEGNAFVEKYHPHDRDATKSDHARSISTRLRLFSFVLFGGEVFFSVHKAGEIAGVACCMRDLAPGVFTVSYLTVDERFRKSGLATALVDSIVRYALAQGCRILDISSFTSDGEKYLKPVFRRHAGAINLHEEGVPYRP